MYPHNQLSAKKSTPFGSLMQGRTYSSTAYRFGFNGKEKEADGTSDNYDFGARIYDGRLGRWLSLDPLFKERAFTAAYNAMLNNPLFYNDPSGRKEFQTIYVIDKVSGETLTIRKCVSNDIMTDGVKEQATDISGSEYDANYYYDYETSVTLTINEDGTITSSPITTTIMKDRGVQDDDGIYFSPAKNGDTKYDWGAIFDEGDRKLEQPGGISLTTKDKNGAVSPTKYFTKTEAKDLDFDNLFLMAKMGSFQKAQNLYDRFSTIATGIGDYLNAFVEKVKEAHEKQKKEPCTVTGCSNKLCQRHDEEKVKNNPKIPCLVPSGTPAEKSWHGDGKEVEVDCDKAKE